MRKLSIITVCLLFILTTVLAGCSSSNKEGSGSNDGTKVSEETNTGTNVEPQKPIKLSLWTFQEQHKDYYDKTAELWNEANPNEPIELTVDTYPNAEMHNKLLIALQSGVGAPDITDININYFSNFLKGDIQLRELNDIIDPVKENVVQSRIDIYSKDGKNYGVPFHVGATVVYYNKDIMDKAGVNPDTIDTWADYVEAGKQVLAKTGIPMTAFEVTNQRPFWPMINQQNSDYLDEDGNVILDNETNIKTLQAMQDMITKDKVAIPMPGGATGSEEFFTFMNKGGIGSLIMPMWYMSRFLSYMPDLEGDILVRPMPIWEEGDFRSSGQGGTGTAITLQGKNQDFAAKFLSFAKLTKEANIRIWQELSFAPVRWDVWDAPELQIPDEYFGNEKIFDVLLNMKDSITSPSYGELSSAAQDLVINNIMFKVLKEQSETPEQALKAAADELRKQ